MSEAMRLWVETSFNIVYLIAVWWIVLVMWQRRSLVAESDRRTAWLMMLAFFFLGLGDIGHVGFRLVAFALGGLETSVQLFGRQLRTGAHGLPGNGDYIHVFLYRHADDLESAL